MRIMPMNRRHLLGAGIALVHALGVAQIVRAGVDVPVRQLLRIVEPQPHQRAGVEIVRAQLRLRKTVFEILEDDVRFDQDTPVMVDGSAPQPWD